ncbi:MAG TPA: hypothetical protein VFF69_08745 [Phycisphaerales bacterium]|nr:hypothetical protein [Phycisphaerales bacterium]
MIRRAASSRRARRTTFWVYALAIVTLTHWPGLAVETPFELRADILVHSAIFFTWTLLLAGCSYFGAPPHGAGNAGGSTIAAAAYAAIDELTQGIPGINRSVDPLDLVANVLGVALAWLALRLVAARSTSSREGP